MHADLLPIKGSPASPYTRKMLALLRFRRIPYRYIQAGHGVEDDLPQPKVNLIPIVYFADNQGTLQAEVDSTPIIRRLEDEYPGRSVIPSSPAMAFINYLLEDYADEWLTKAMFHYRWHYAPDIEMAGSVLPHYGGVNRPDAQLKEMQQIFSERQISRLYVVGSNPETAPVIEQSYRGFLAALNAHLTQYPHLLGNRPASADFACFGQLTQLAQFDPTPAQIVATEYPRIHAWVSKVEDLCGLEVPQADAEDDGFLRIDEPNETLRGVLSEIGKTYVPVMLANAAAIDQGLEKVSCEVQGASWVQEPFPYQAKCLQWLRIEYAKLSAAEREEVDALLAGTGCEELVAPPA